MNRLSKAWRLLAVHAFIARAILTNRRPRFILRFDGGIGDKLLCTVVCRELAKRGRARTWMLSEYPEMFANNPDIELSLRVGYPGVRWWIETFKLNVRGMVYASYEGGRDAPPPVHIITEMCRRMGLAGEIEKRPYLCLTRQEKARAGSYHGAIAIQSSGLAAIYPKRTKEWFPERFQEVVDSLRTAHTVVQLGSKNDFPLDGVVDLRGRTSIRESAAILQQAKVFIGLAGFLMHLARSVDCPAVIVYGGEEWPEQTGYACNENLTNHPHCSPCWRYECPYAMECMSNITPSMVLRAVDRLFSLESRPLAVDKEMIASVETPDVLGRVGA